MKRLTFTIHIQASAEKVWNILWDDTTYRHWTSAFSPGSCAQSDWQLGSPILFLGSEGVEGGGMSAVIHEKEEGRRMVFRHIGAIAPGAKEPHIDESWSGALEGYELTPAEGGTQLTVQLDTLDEYESYFQEKFPLALSVVKELAEGTLRPVIIVVSTVEAPAAKVWECWTDPAHITQWCQASDDWHAPFAENDVREGGRFVTRMAAKDGSVSFDFEGVYTSVEKHQKLAYKMPDGREVQVHFNEQEGKTQVVEYFHPESMNSHELQRGGWQAILNNFKRHVEAH